MSCNVVCFSGGKDSTAMLLLMLEKKIPIDYVVFADTTKEYPDLYDHLDKVDEYLKEFGLKIERLEVDFDYWFFEHVRTKGPYKSKKGYGWPTPLSRWCTCLKRKRIEAFLDNLDSVGVDEKIIKYIGIAADEPKRLRKSKSSAIVFSYPLADFGFTERMALKYCYEKGFRWNGLYEKVTRVSCYCCPLANLGNFKAIRKHFPDLWNKIREMDKASLIQYTKNYTFDELDKKLERECDDAQNSIFDDLVGKEALEATEERRLFF